MIYQNILLFLILKKHGPGWRATVRNFCAGGDEHKLASYEDVAKVGKDTLLIDVREPWELKETGLLPNSINIPLGQVEEAFKLTAEQFKTKYGREKPDDKFPVIFSCKAGIRSSKALKAIESIGYKNVRNYKGGWLDWEEQQKK